MNMSVNEYILLIYPALLILIACYKCVFYRKDDFSPATWDRDQSKMLQAIACIGVILHHLTQDITSYGYIYRGPITILSSMGILFTSVFFFFSGYGLIISVYNNPRYLRTFLRHRLTTILVPFFTANTVCVLLRIFYTHIPTTPYNIFRSILGLTLLNGNGWYIVEIFYLYIIFYVLFRFIKNKNIAITLLCIASILLIKYSYGLGHDYSDIGDRPFYGEWWYNSTIVFSMGVLFARFKEKIIIFLKNHYRVTFLITLCLFIIAFVVEEITLKTRGYYSESATVDMINDKFVTLLSQMALCLIFTFLTLLVNMKIRLGNCMLKFIGSISMELFLIHGVFLNTIFDFTHTNECIMYAVTIACSIPAAAIMHYINAPIIKLLSSGKTVKHVYTKEERLAIERRNDLRNKLLKLSAFTIISVATLLAVLYYIYTGFIRAPFECKSEIKNLSHALPGDIVQFGRYETSYAISGKERVEWIVLSNEDNHVMLIAQEGLAGSTYNNEYKPTDWDNSFIRNYLNHVIFDELFSDYETRYIMTNPVTGDKLSLLTCDEAQIYFDDNTDRQLSITEVAAKNNTNINEKSKVNYWDTKGYRSSWWWLRGESESITAPIVTVDGEIISDAKYVNKPNGAVRPVVWVDLEGGN